jgi:hypothetical protein
MPLRRRGSKSTTISYPSATYPCAWRSASWALRPGRNPKLDPENAGSRMGSRTCVIACCTSRSTVPGLDPGIWMPSWRSPPPGLGIETPRRACPREGGGVVVCSYRPAGSRPIFRGSQQSSHAGLRRSSHPHPVRHRSPLPACRPGPGSRRRSPPPSGVALRLVHDPTPWMLVTPRPPQVRFRLPRQRRGATPP